MKMFRISVWLEQDKDNDEPNITYVRFSKQQYNTAHTRLTNEAVKKFRDWGRITVEMDGCKTHRWWKPLNFKDLSFKEDEV